jgi:hypothetical protein
MTIFYCLRFDTSPTWRAMSPYLYPPETGWPGYTPRHWVRFSSPLTTRRATVEIFDSAALYRLPVYNLVANYIGNTVSNSSIVAWSSYKIFSTVASESAAIERCLQRRCLAMTGCVCCYSLAIDVSTGSATPPSGRYIAVL